MNSNLPQSNEERNTAESKDGAKVLTDVEKLNGARMLESYANFGCTDLSAVQLEPGSSDCKSFINQACIISNECDSDSPHLNSTNGCMPGMQIHSSFSSHDYLSAKLDGSCSELSNSIYLSGANDSGSSEPQAVSTISIMRTFDKSFSEDIIGMKRLQSCRRSAFQVFRQVKSAEQVLCSIGSAKLDTVYPAIRLSRTISEHSVVEKCRADDDENVENEYSFRAHLQGTSQNSQISPSLPTTSTPNKLESRHTKRHMVEEMEEAEKAKKMKEDQPMEEDEPQSGGSVETEMEIDVVDEQSGQDSTLDEDDNGVSSGRSSVKENIMSGRSSRASVHRSLSSSLVEVNETKDPRSSPPGILEVNYELETIKNPDIPSTAFVSITAETLASLILSMTREQFMRRFHLIDCRYPFEYFGGHIRGAINLFDPAHVEEFFYPKDVEQRARRMAKKPIFYCEFSQMRGPSIAYELRAFDRKLNVSRYPFVDYPEMYLLQYGYRNFYMIYNTSKPDLFEPLGYVKMTDQAHQQELMAYKFHRTKTISSVYHSLARDRYQRRQMEAEEEAGTSAMETDVSMRTPPRSHLRRLYHNSPESPSHFPVTPTGRPPEDRGESTVGRSCTRRLFSDTGDRKKDQGPKSRGTY